MLVICKSIPTNFNFCQCCFIYSPPHHQFISLHLNNLVYNIAIKLEKITQCTFIISKTFFLTLQYCIGFAIYQHESATGIHMFPILNPPPTSLLPPRTIPLGCPSAPAPSIQYRSSNLDRQLISYMILYIFQ